jgi:hypothetical protein
VARHAKRKTWLDQISATSAPYLVSMLLAAAGWAVTHVVDRTLASPIIEYRTFVKPAESGERHFRVSLSNLSTQAFSDTTFEIQGSDEATLVSACDPPWEQRSPAWVSETRPESGNNAIRFRLSQIHPDWQVTLCVIFKGKGAPNFILKETERGRPLRLIGCSIETFFVRHETQILLCLAGIWVVGSLLLIFRPR